MEEVTQNVVANCFAGVSAENVSRPITGLFKEVNNSQAFTVARKKKEFFFLNEPLPGAPRRLCTKFKVSRKNIYDELTA